MQYTNLPSYPPLKIHQTHQSMLTILQLTDLHLCFCDFQDGNCSDKESQSYSHHSGNDFRACLKQAFAERDSIDLIIVTGDLIHEMNSKIYDYIFNILEKTGVPFVCIAGNHDVTDEVGDASMLFEDYNLIPYPTDKRLVSCHSIESEHWQLLFLNSANPGSVHGMLSKESLQWLKNELTINNKPAILCLHHHVAPMDSHWIDQQILLNADELWQTILPFLHLKAVVHGHVHQEKHLQKQHVQIFATPATCYQFKPDSYEFSFDDARPGYRWLSLLDDGSIESSVQRLNQ